MSSVGGSHYLKQALIKHSDDLKNMQVGLLAAVDVCIFSQLEELFKLSRMEAERLMLQEPNVPQEYI